MSGEIAFARPWLGEEEIALVAETIRSGWIMQGPQVAAFESEFATTVGAAGAVAVSNCTTALQLALTAVGVKFGDVVITASHSFIATGNSIRACGAEPVFVDIDPLTLNIAPEALERCLVEDFIERDGALWYRHVDRLAVGESPLTRAAAPRGRLTALLVVHQAGVAADLGALLPLARRYGLPVIEDAACALGSEVSLDGGATFAPIGRPHADLACFSFHPRKVITTGEGGMVTAAGSAHERLVRLMREHGMTHSTANRDSQSGVVIEDYLVTGHNFRLTDIQAAIGRVQLGRLPAIIARRGIIGGWYAERLAALSGVSAPFAPAYARVNHQSYIVRLDDPSRQLPVMRKMKELGIATRIGITCIHRQIPYHDAWPVGALPHSERAREDSIILPMHPLMTEDEVDRVVASIATALKE